MIVIVEELREGFAEHKSRGVRRTISTTRGPLHEILHSVVPPTRIEEPRGGKISKCRAHPRSDALLRTRTVTSSQGGPRRGSSQGRVASSALHKVLNQPIRDR